VFVFFAAGHGQTVDGHFYFLPQDFRSDSETAVAQRGIDQDQLQKWFASIPARKSILLFDSCESGSLTGAGVLERGSLEDVTALYRMTQATGRTVLTATTDDAPAQANGPIYVKDLVQFIEEEVPELSYSAFKVRHVPKDKIVGADFPLINKFAVLSDADVAEPSLPSKPTHVVITPTDVRQTANDSAPVVLQLPPGSQVYLVDTAGGWVLVARDGKKLGYVERTALAKLQ
jgi:hypothetical protein